MANSPSPTIRGTQVGLKHPEQVDQMKADILADRFYFEELRARIGGVIDRRGIYHVIEGHHRIVAAIEVLDEFENATPLLEIIRCGNWDLVDKPPRGSRPLPSRTFWGAMRNWLGF